MGKSLSPLKTGSSTSIEHPATSISTPQAKNLINAHKLVGLRPWLRYLGGDCNGKTIAGKTNRGRRVGGNNAPTSAA